MGQAADSWVAISEVGLVKREGDVVFGSNARSGDLLADEEARLAQIAAGSRPCVWEVAGREVRRCEGAKVRSRANSEFEIFWAAARRESCGGRSFAARPLPVPRRKLGCFGFSV
jgi:hypothetical protein